MRFLYLLFVCSSLNAANAPLDSLIWVSEEAAQDSLSSYWDNLDSDWYTPLTPEEIGVGLTEAEYDSLLSESDSKLYGMANEKPWRFKFNKFARTGFNRVEGFHPGVEFGLSKPGWRQPKFTVGASYGISSTKVMWDGKADIPLYIKKPKDKDGRATDYPWTMLSFNLSGGRHTANFGGLDREVYNFTSMIYGEDPNHYYEADYWESYISYRPFKKIKFNLGGGTGTNRSMQVATKWSLLGSENDIEQNYQIEGLNHRTLFSSFLFRHYNFDLTGKATWRRISDYQSQEPFWARQYDVSARYKKTDRFGNEISLKSKVRRVSRTSPVEWKMLLGDYGSLRGFEAMELVGDKGAFASIDFRFGSDPLSPIGVPLFDALSIQPVLFFDSGWVEELENPSTIGGTGWRHNAGIGFSKYYPLPGLFERITVYAAKPVGENSEDKPWRFVLGFN